MSVFNQTKTYRPFTYPWAMELAIEHNQDLYWETHQIDMIDDIRQYHGEGGLATANASHEATKNMLNKVLALFTQMDMEAGGLYCKLLPHIGNNEIRNMWMNFASRESTHQRGYAMGVEVLEMPESTWGEFMEYVEMSDKIETMTNLDGMDLTKPVDFAKVVGQLLLAEGICLFGAFACMLNLKRFGLMMGLNMINEWSLRDEERHVDGNLMVLNAIRVDDLSDSEQEELNVFLRDMARRYAEAEFKFIDLVFEMGPVEDMTAEDMKNYIKYLSDLRLRHLGVPTLYGVDKNPLEWMDYVLSGKQHTNFFEAKVGEYSHSGLSGDIDYGGYMDKVKLNNNKALLPK